MATAGEIRTQLVQAAQDENTIVESAIAHLKSGGYIDEKNRPEYIIFVLLRKHIKENQSLINSLVIDKKENP